MKKSLFLIIFLLFINCLFFAQNSAELANRNTAIRCYKLAENCLMGRDWGNALNQAELGLSYDDSISDLIYVQAVAKINLGESKNEVLKIINQAFEKDNWISYSKSGARLILADLLSDTGALVESLNVLDEEPLLYSADAEFIRIKNYYRIGTKESYNQARLKINSSRRVYSGDSRFAEIFFLYEMMIKVHQYLVGERESFSGPSDSELVDIIAKSYIEKLPDYTNLDNSLEISAAIFAEEKIKNRLISAIDAKGNNKNPLFVLLALENGFYNQTESIDMFFDYAKNLVNLDLLEVLAKMISEEDAKNHLAEKLNEFDGKLFIDANCDLQNEVQVKYSLGRPEKIILDSDNDGINDLVIDCDYGTPVFLEYTNPKVQLEYDIYPCVKSVYFTQEDCKFNFMYDDYVFSPCKIVPDDYIEKTGTKFYVPYIFENLEKITFSDLMMKTASIQMPLAERENSSIVYTLSAGNLCFAKFYEKNQQYAYCDFQSGLPFVRYVDYDYDGIYDTTELYDVYDVDSGIIYDDSDLIKNVFSKVAENQNIYLKQIKIDRNANKYYEYSEEFLGDNGRCCLWDNDDNGLTDVKYTKFPYKDDASVLEETVFYDESGNEIVSINSIDNVPIKMIYKKSEVMIFAGEENSFYWIDNAGTTEQEKFVLSKISSLKQGDICVVQSDDSRFLVIKVFNDCFCRIVNEDESLSE